MIRTLRTAALSAVVALAGCDFQGDDILIEPEYDLSYSFESGFQDWSPAGTDLDDPPVDWEVSRTAEHASEGGQSVRLRLDNVNDQGKIWIERAFDVAPDTAYTVEIAFDLGTSDTGDVNLWTVLAGATAERPQGAADLTPRENTGGAQGEDVTWLEKRYTSTVTSSEDGRIWVHVGVWGTWETERTYYVDDVRVVFRRVSPAP